jgi:CBS domain-containing protein
MCVGQICTRQVDTATSNELVSVVAERMHQRSVGTLIVVSQSSQVIGIVTDRDLVMRVIAKGLCPAKTHLHEVMTVAPKTVMGTTPIKNALLIMRTGRFRRLPVVDESYKLIGLVTLDDFLMLLAEEFMQIGRLIKRETPLAIANAQEFGDAARLQNRNRAPREAKSARPRSTAKK